MTGLLGNDEDEQARYIEASFGEVRVASVYLPNGKPVGTEKFSYKVCWMERLIQHTRNCCGLRSRLCSPVTTISVRPMMMFTIRSRFAMTRCAGSKRAHASARCSISG